MWQCITSQSRRPGKRDLLNVLAVCSTIHQSSALGMDDVRAALTSNREDINTDTEGVGHSPSQMVLGKNPRVIGAAGANDLRSRLQTRADEASFARMQAMREAAKLCMLRVHYARALRRAAVARPRPTLGWDHYSVGDVVCTSSENKRPSRRSSS